MRRITSYLLTLAIVCFTSARSLVPGSLAATRSGAQQAASTPASSTEVKAGLGLDKMELTGASETFEIAPDTRIYGWARVKGVAAGSNVAIAFKKGDKEVYREEVSIPSVPYRINAYRTFRSGDAGDWKLVIAGADGKELASTAFKVEITK